MPVIHQGAVNGNLNGTVLGASAGIYLGDRFLSRKNKTVLPGLGILYAAVSAGPSAVYAFRDLVDQLVEIPAPFILNGLKFVSCKGDAA